MYRLHRTSNQRWREVVQTSVITDTKAPQVPDGRRPSTAGIQSKRNALHKQLRQQGHTTHAKEATDHDSDGQHQSPQQKQTQPHEEEEEERLHEEAAASGMKDSDTDAEEEGDKEEGEENAGNEGQEAPQPSATALLEASSLSLKDCVDPAALRRLKDEFDLHVPDEDKGLWSPPDVPQLDPSEDPFRFSETGPPALYHAVRREVHRVQGLPYHCDGVNMSYLRRADAAAMKPTIFHRKTWLWQALATDAYKAMDKRNSKKRSNNDDHLECLSRFHHFKAKYKRECKHDKAQKIDAVKVMFKEFEETFKASTWTVAQFRKGIDQLETPDPIPFRIYRGEQPKELPPSKAKSAAAAAATATVPSPSPSSASLGTSAIQQTNGKAWKAEVKAAVKPEAKEAVPVVKDKETEHLEQVAELKATIRAAEKKMKNVTQELEQLRASQRRALGEGQMISAVANRAAKIHVSIARRDISRITKSFNLGRQAVQHNSRKVAAECQRRLRQTIVKSSVKAEKDKMKRCRKLVSEMMLFWKRNEKLEKEKRKRAEKELQEKRKRDLELREAKRQQRKFNFLITQTELYAHFMSRKLTQGGSNEEKEMERILGKIEETPVHVSDPSLGLDGEGDQEGDETDEQLKRRALEQAREAVLKHQQRTQQFDAHTSQQDKKDEGLNQENFDQQFSLANPNVNADMQQVTQPSMLRGHLKEYQLKGLQWLAGLYSQGINGILADEMGLGKTVQSIATLAHLAECESIWGPFLVVTPASTLNNWCNEILKFCPDFKVIPYWGTQAERKLLRTFLNPAHMYTRDADFHVMVTSYDMVVRDSKHIGKVQWQYMILDEAQAIKSSSSHRWTTLLKFNCRNRLLLTGTPIQNTMAELWALLHFIMPTLFDSHAEFNQWFSKDIESHAANSNSELDRTQLSRLHMILKPFMLRRVKKNVEHELPGKTEVLKHCHLTARQQRLHQRLKSNLRIDQLVVASATRGSSGRRGADKEVEQLLNLMMQFRKVCNHPNLLNRRMTRTSFVIEAPRWRPGLEPPEAIIFVPMTTESAITWTLPRLLLDHTVRRLPHQQGSLSHVPWLAERCGVHSPAHVHASMIGEEWTSPLHWLPPSTTNVEKEAQQRQRRPYRRPMLTSSTNGSSQGADADGDVRMVSPLHGCLRLAGISAQEVHDTMTATPAEQLLLARLALLHAQQRRLRYQCLGDEARTWRDPLLLLPPSAVNRIDPTITCAPRHGILRSTKLRYNTVAFFVPPALAPPPFPTCSNRSYDRLLEPAITGEGDAFTSVFFGHTASQKVRPPRLASATLDELPKEGWLSAARPRHGWIRIFQPTMEDVIRDSGKLQALDRLMSRLQKEGHRVLIYSQMTRMIDILEDFMTFRKYKYMRLDGSCKISERRDMVADFQSRSDIFAFILSTRAGGIGINLTAADTVIFYDSDWNPTVDQQAMDRAHRLGQTRPVTVYRLVTKGTVEERILMRAQEKSKVHQLVIQGGGFAPEKLKSKEVVSLLLDDELERKLEEERRKEEEKKKELADRRKNRRRQKESAADENGTGSGEGSGRGDANGGRRASSVAGDSSRRVPQPTFVQPAKKRRRSRKKKSTEPTAGDKTDAVAAQNNTGSAGASTAGAGSEGRGAQSATSSPSNNGPKIRKPTPAKAAGTNAAEEKAAPSVDATNALPKKRMGTTNSNHTLSTAAVPRIADADAKPETSTEGEELAAKKAKVAQQ